LIEAETSGGHFRRERIRESFIVDVLDNVIFGFIAEFGFEFQGFNSVSLRSVVSENIRVVAALSLDPLDPLDLSSEDKFEAFYEAGLTASIGTMHEMETVIRVEVPVAFSLDAIVFREEVFDVLRVPRAGIAILIPLVGGAKKPGEGASQGC